MRDADTGMSIKFTTKKQAEVFLKTVRDFIYKFDVVTVNDVMKVAGMPLRAENYTDGLHYGYIKKDILKVKPVKASNEDGTVWEVILPPPGRMVRGPHGYWTTERKDIHERGGDA